MGRAIVRPDGTMEVQGGASATMGGPAPEPTRRKRARVAPDGSISFQDVLPTPPVVTDVLDAIPPALAQGATAGLGLMDLATKYLGPIAQMRPGGTPDPSNLRGSALEAIGEQFPSTRYEPKTLPGRVNEAAIRGGTAAMALPGPLSVPKQAMNVLSGVTGEIGAQVAEESGLGPGWQMAAGIGAGMLPGMVGAGARHMAESQRIRESIEGMAQPPGTPPPNVVEKAARELQGMTSEQYRPEMLRELEDVIDYFPEGQRPTTTQSLGELAGANLASRERLLGKTDEGFSTRLFETKRNAENYAEEVALRSRPEGNAEMLGSDFRAAHEARRQVVRDAYVTAGDEMARRVNMEPVAQRIQMFVDLLPVARRKFVPKEAIETLDELAEQYGSQVPVEELDALSSTLKELARDPSASRSAQAVAHEMIDALESGISDAVGPDSPLYPARAAHREMAQTYEPPNPGSAKRTQDPERMAQAQAAYALTSEQNRIVNAIVAPQGGIRPVDVARKARVALQDDPQAMENLHAALWNKIVGDTLEGGSVHSAIKRMKDQRLRSAYVELFGESAWNRNKRMLKMIEVARRGSSGRTEEAERTGSFANAQMATAAAAGQLSKREIAMMISKNGYARLMRTLKNQDEVDALMREAFVDPKVAKDLLEVPVERNMAAWEEKMRAHAARAALRQAAMQGSVH